MTLFFLGIVALCVAAGIFYTTPQSVAGKRIGSVLPLPVAFVDMTHIITSRQWYDNITSVEHFYTVKHDDLVQRGVSVDFNGSEGQQLLRVKEKGILNKMIEDTLVQVIATQKGLTVSEGDVAQAVDQKLDALGNREAVQQQLAQEYGWSLDDFKQRIVRPSLFSEALEKLFMKEKWDTSNAKTRIQAAQAELNQAKSFDEVAMKYSEGATAQAGGDLGWLPLDALAPEVVVVVKGQALNTPTGIIESSIGYHIILLTEKKQEGSQALVHLKQILIRRQAYPEWLITQEPQYRVWILPRGYTWNRDQSQVEFTDQGLKHFEQNIQQEASGMIL
jgi:hypothetical protein